MRTDQRGAAIVMALLVVAVTTVVVSGAFLLQSAVAQQVENAMAASQAKRLLEGAVDWVRVILMEDARSTATDHLGEAWAVSLEETRIDDEGDSPAWVSGAIEDAQSRFNLRNVAGESGPVASEVAVLRRLLELVGEEPRFADEIAIEVGGMQVVRPGSTQAERVLPAVLDDIEANDPALRRALDRISPFVTLIPVASAINVNTAPAEVLAARLGNLSLVDARRVVASRERAPFRDLADVAVRIQGLDLGNASGQLSVASQFFLVNGIAEFRKVRVQATALLKRQANAVEVVWVREVAA